MLRRRSRPRAPAKLQTRSRATRRCEPRFGLYFSIYQYIPTLPTEDSPSTSLESLYHKRPSPARGTLKKITSPLLKGLVWGPSPFVNPLYLPLQPTLPATSTLFTCHFDPVYLPPRRPLGGTQHDAERQARWCEVPQNRYRLRGSLAAGGGSGRDGVPPPSVTPAVADGTATLPRLVWGLSPFVPHSFDNLSN